MKSLTNLRVVEAGMSQIDRPHAHDHKSSAPSFPKSPESPVVFAGICKFP